MQVLAPSGERIGMIRLPEVCANVCFGGVKRNRLFMVASQSLYAVYVETPSLEAAVVWAICLRKELGSQPTPQGQHAVTVLALTFRRDR